MEPIVLDHLEVTSTHPVRCEEIISAIPFILASLM